MSTRSPSTESRSRAQRCSSTTRSGLRVGRRLPATSIGAISTQQTNRPSLKDILFGGDPYEGFPLDEWPGDLQGWGSKHRLFGELIRALRPDFIIEVGTWKGGSAIHMADQMEEIGLAGQILCIDTWLGSPWVYVRKDHTYSSLLLRNGFPQLYYTFASNVIRAGHKDRIVPLAQTSDNAFTVLREFEISAPLIYVDAAHEYEPVKKDVTNYFTLLEDDGVMMGDDYSKESWPGVVRAVDEFVAEHGLNLYVDTTKWAASRRDVRALLGK